ncbi:hypothetical protein H4219_006011, partial [Mycoemilia scoparia]
MDGMWPRELFVHVNLGVANKDSVSLEKEEGYYRNCCPEELGFYNNFAKEYEVLGYDDLVILNRVAKIALDEERHFDMLEGNDDRES